MINAKIIADSKFGDVRLTTVELVYPRIIHGELMTHRLFSRNASSSRAVPVKRRVEDIKDNGYKPAIWRLNQKGMQPKGEPATGLKAKTANFIWEMHRIVSTSSMMALANLGIAKELGNRLGEAHELIKVVVTATEWDNFFELRNHPDAQLEIQTLAREIKHAMDTSATVIKREGEWHLPYITAEEEITVDNKVLLAKMSAARCARVSYNLHDGAKPNVEKDLQLFSQLIESKPMHASPVEHQAVFYRDLMNNGWREGVSHVDRNGNIWSGNFKGCIQFRKIIEQRGVENVA
jgi:thymidylate synthase ThyX